jgi:hypothetical protein
VPAGKSLQRQAGSGGNLLIRKKIEYIILAMTIVAIAFINFFYLRFLSMSATGQTAANTGH